MYTNKKMMLSQGAKRVQMSWWESKQLLWREGYNDLVFDTIKICCKIPIDFRHPDISMHETQRPGQPGSKEVAQLISTPVVCWAPTDQQLLSYCHFLPTCCLWWRISFVPSVQWWRKKCSWVVALAFAVDQSNEREDLPQGFPPWDLCVQHLVSN